MLRLIQEAGPSCWQPSKNKSSCTSSNANKKNCSSTRPGRRISLTASVSMLLHWIRAAIMLYSCAFRWITGRLRISRRLWMLEEWRNLLCTMRWTSEWIRSSGRRKSRSILQPICSFQFRLVTKGRVEWLSSWKITFSTRTIKSNTFWGSHYEKTAPKAERPNSPATASTNSKASSSS